MTLPTADDIPAMVALLRTAAAYYIGIAQPAVGATCDDIAGKLERFQAWASHKQRNYAFKLIQRANLSLPAATAPQQPVAWRRRSTIWAQPTQQPAAVPQPQQQPVVVPVVASIPNVITQEPAKTEQEPAVDDDSLCF